MRVKGYVLIYGYLGALLCLASFLGLRFARDEGVLPEGLVLCGALLCGFSVMFGIFLLELQSDKLLSSYGAGRVLFEQDCIVHLDRKHGVPYHIAMCQNGVVLDAGSKHFEILRYEDLRVLKASEFEVLVKAYDNTQYRFVFPKKLRMAAVRDTFERMAKLPVQELTVSDKISGKHKVVV